MKGLAFEVRCLHCCGPMALLAEGTSRVVRTSAMVKCESCGREHLVSVALEPIARPESLRRRELRAVG